MKKFRIAQYFWVWKLFASLGLIWSTQVIQGTYHFVTSRAEGVPWEVARTGQDSMEAFWSHRIEEIQRYDSVGGYTPAMYFADYRKAREIWMRVTGDTLTLIGLSQGQNRAMIIMESAHPSRIAIDAGYKQFIEPIRPPSKPIDWSDFQNSIIAWLIHFYWFGLLFAGILFAVWYHENPYFNRFAGSSARLLVVTVLWPVFIWLMFKRKFEDHYYSLMAEVMVRRTKQFIGSTLTAAEKKLVHKLVVERAGLRGGVQYLQQLGVPIRHGLLTSLFVVSALHISAQIMSSISLLPSYSSSRTQKIMSDQRIYFLEAIRDPGFSTQGDDDCMYVHTLDPGFLRPQDDRMFDLVVLVKIFFHYWGRILIGFIRLQDPVPRVE